MAQIGGIGLVSSLTATFAVVTPLFGGGADPRILAELRPPAIKGILRFWWRALAWSRYGDLETIRQKEAKIFGSAGDGNTGGQARFLLRVTAPSTPRASRPPEILRGSDGTVIGDGARYFGYGLMQAFGAKAGQLNRPCLLPILEFTVDLVSRETPDRTLVDALKLTGLLGGIGSRTRRGWGSLTLTSLKQDKQKIWEQPRAPDDYRGQLRAILSAETLRDDEPPYSAFCKRTRIDIVGEDSDPLRVLNTVGEEMLRYRSWGKNGKVGNISVDRVAFKDDHDWFVEENNFATTSPRRIVFGLPHNYSKTLGVMSKSFDRRASPLLVHLHQLAPKHHIAVLTILHSHFLPQGEPLWIWQRKPERPGGKPEKIPENELRQQDPDWRVLATFANRFSARTTVLP